ncbi:uncharacterized protein LOC141630140 [Silene latifolia]|uniref:uncharacterized protein LOC141630140 n=1 Tax=Silene latifolia TaxID=37657 RepID=UPI003D789297
MRRGKDIDLNEILVQTEWMGVCRKAMQSLQNRHWGMDLVLNMYGVTCTYDRNDILYLPSTVQYDKPSLSPKNGNIVWCPHLKMHYKPENGATIYKVFFTIGNGNHWFACMSDIKKQENYILDSCKPNTKNIDDMEEYNSYMEDIVWTLLLVLYLCFVIISYD